MYTLICHAQTLDGSHEQHPQTRVPVPMRWASIAKLFAHFSRNYLSLTKHKCVRVRMHACAYCRLRSKLLSRICCAHMIWLRYLPWTRPSLSIVCLFSMYNFNCQRLMILTNYLVCDSFQFIFDSMSSWRANAGDTTHRIETTKKHEIKFCTTSRRRRMQFFDVSPDQCNEHKSNCGLLNSVWSSFFSFPPCIHWCSD